MKFIKTSGISVCGLERPPINMDLCKTYITIDEAAMYSIKFIMIDNSEIYWTFKNINARDEVLKRLDDLLMEMTI